MTELKNASPLGVLSRTVVNRNVKREDVDSLPLPRTLIEECFENLTTDRSNESFRPQSLEPCYCKDDLLVSDFRSWTPRWSENFEPGFSTMAEWLELPTRETLKDRLRRATSNRERECMRACLNTLRFDASTGLGRVHDWIRRYLYYEDVHGWYFVSMRFDYMNKFLRVAKLFEIVLLPYGCITASFGIERLRSTRNWRHMVLAVRNDHGKFWRILFPLDFGQGGQTVLKISDAMQFVKTISSVSRPEYITRPFTQNYFIFEPMIKHAIWWMLLLIPHAYVKREQSFKRHVQNCVVLLDPWYQCIGDPVETTTGLEDGSHVYWFDRQTLNVKEIPNVVHRDKKSFIKWCASRNMNTLMNLNGNDNRKVEQTSRNVQ